MAGRDNSGATNEYLRNMKLSNSCRTELDTVILFLNFYFIRINVYFIAGGDFSSTK